MTQRFWRLGRERDQMARRFRGFATRNGGYRRPRRFFQNQMRVGAAEPERTDAGPQRRIGVDRYPRTELIHDVERRIIERDPGVDPTEILKPGQLSMPECEQDLDDAGNAGRRFQVTDIRFHRTQAAIALVERRTLVLGKRRERLKQAFEFDRVAFRSAGAMKLDEVQRTDRHLCAFVRGHDHIRLRARSRVCEGIGFTAMVDRGALDHAVDAIAIDNRFLQGFQQQKSSAFPAHVTIGAVVEGLAGTGGRKHAHFRERNMPGRGEYQIDAARQRHLAIAVFQRLDRAVDGVQGTRTGGIDRNTRPAEIEEVRNAIGDDRRRRARGLMRFDGSVAALLQLFVVVIEDADQYADFPASHPRRRDARIFQARPGQFEHDPLLRVHILRDFRQQSEELMIECVDIFDETAPFAERFVEFQFRIAPQRPPVPALGGYFGDVRLALREMSPECLGIIRPRKAESDADNSGFHTCSCTEYPIFLPTGCAHRPCRQPSAANGLH